MSRDPIPTWFFVKVVVQQGDRYLLVQECNYDQTWHLPAGRAKPGEALVAAASRETLEETGVPIVLDGILRIEHSPHADKAFLGAIFLAHPATDTPSKSTPDDESLCAAWFHSSPRPSDYRCANVTCWNSCGLSRRAVSRVRSRCLLPRAKRLAREDTRDEPTHRPASPGQIRLP